MAGLALAVAGVIALNVPGVVDAKYRQLTSEGGAQPGGGGSRLFSGSTNGRRAHWDVAAEQFRRNQLRGAGEGTYELAWVRERPNTVNVKNAHSLYLETLGELGLVGFVLLVVALALILGAFAHRARGPDRAMFAALLAAGLAWVAANGVDWGWEMPATTVWLFAFGGAALARSPGGEPRTWPRAWGVAARGLAIAACIALAVTPARTAIAAARFEDALADFERGDCRGAKLEARSAISAQGQRAAPYALIAFCDSREGRYRAALAAARAAHERDPHSWETRYGLAAARAAVGLDPRAAAKQAAILNPHGPQVSAAQRLSEGRGRRAWIAAGRSAMLLPPSPDQP
jgi:hypothetical protein